MTARQKLIEAFEEAGFDVRTRHDDVIYIQNDDGNAVVAIEFDYNGNVKDAEAFGV